MASQQEDYYRWHPPGGQRTVHLSLEVVDRVLQDVLRGFASLPKRGAEVGGLLLGRSAGTEIWIDGHEPIPCGYAHGPSYELKGKDEERLKEAVRQAEGAVVGFYRSDTRGDTALDGEDLRILNQYLPGDNALALLIRPYATKVSRAGIFFRENGDFQHDATAEFPFSRKLLRPESAPANRPDAPPVEKSEPIAEPERPPAQLPVAPQARWDRWAAALTLAVALGWSGGYFTARRTAPPPDPATFRLGLTAERSGNSFAVTWDRQAIPLRTAVRGELRVEDGGRVKAVPLELDQLRMGKAVYDGLASQIRFELRVQQTAGGVLSEVLELTRSASAVP